VLELLEGYKGNAVCFKASDILVEKDYTGIFEPAMKAVLSQYGSFRLYADLSALTGVDETS